jgi:hypothetical protein
MTTDPGLPVLISVVLACPHVPSLKRDLLADVAEVLGTEKVSAADVPPRLRKIAPGYLPYRSLSGVRLPAFGMLQRHGTLPIRRRRLVRQVR